MIERERTFLAKELPQWIQNMEPTSFADHYIPATHPHPKLRLRIKGAHYELTKKTVITEGDSSQFIEQTIVLDHDEMTALIVLPAKSVSKQRYSSSHEGCIEEVDVFTGALEGLVLIDFEFDTKEAMDAFVPPEYCLCDVTQEKAIAGGMLCGATYEDIAHTLSIYHYNKLS